MVRQHHPDLEFLSVSVGINLAFRPHRDRNSLERESTVKGAANLPEVVEGQTDPAPRDDAYAADRHRTQSEVGSLFWVGLRTRPDLLATVGALSCMSTVNPGKTYKLATQVWRYLAGTRNKVLFFKAGGALQEATLSIFGDASLAPVASRSRTGVVVKFGGYVIAYRTQRQSLTAFSAFEAEVEAPATAYQFGMQVKMFLDKFLQKSVDTELFGDNSACVSNLTKGSEYVQPTRTRHFGMRCSYFRDHLKNDGIPMLHMSGELIPADGLTKTLSRARAWAGEVVVLSPTAASAFRATVQRCEGQGQPKATPHCDVHQVGCKGGRCVRKNCRKMPQATYRHADRMDRTESGGGRERPEPRPEATRVLERKCEVRKTACRCQPGFLRRSSPSAAGTSAPRARPALLSELACSLRTTLLHWLDSWTTGFCGLPLASTGYVQRLCRFATFQSSPVHLMDAGDPFLRVASQHNAPSLVAALCCDVPAARYLGYQDQQLLRAAPCKYRVRAVLMSLCDFQSGSVHLMDSGDLSLRVASEHNAPVIVS
eukprot:s2258_g10.t1